MNPQQTRQGLTRSVRTVAQEALQGALTAIFPEVKSAPCDNDAPRPSLRPQEISILVDALSSLRAESQQKTTASRFDFRRVRLPGQPGRRRLFRAAVVRTHDGVDLGLNSDSYRRIRTDSAGRIVEVTCDGEDGSFTLLRAEEPDRSGYAHWLIGTLKLGRYLVDIDNDGLLVFRPEGAKPFKLKASGAWQRL